MYKQQMTMPSATLQTFQLPLCALNNTSRHIGKLWTRDALFVIISFILSFFEISFLYSFLSPFLATFSRSLFFLSCDFSLLRMYFFFLRFFSFSLYMNSFFVPLCLSRFPVLVSFFILHTNKKKILYDIISSVYICNLSSSSVIKSFWLESLFFLI